MMTGPLGYHVHLSSTTQFVFGDEEAVMSQLTKVKFMMTGPLGYHVYLCSTTQFVFGDEEAVMSQLTKVGLTDIMC